MKPILFPEGQTDFSTNPSIRFSFANSGIGGSITIGGRTISVQDPGSAEDFIIDCERQDIYLLDSKENKNNAFVLSDGEFFELKPGRNVIEFVGMHGNLLHVTPN